VTCIQRSNFITVKNSKFAPLKALLAIFITDNLYNSPTEYINNITYIITPFIFPTLNYRDIEELLAARGITVSYETIRQWCQRLGQKKNNTAPKVFSHK